MLFADDIVVVDETIRVDNSKLEAGSQKDLWLVGVK